LLGGWTQKTVEYQQRAEGTGLQSHARDHVRSPSSPLPDHSLASQPRRPFISPRSTCAVVPENSHSLTHAQHLNPARSVNRVPSAIHRAIPIVHPSCPIHLSLTTTHVGTSIPAPLLCPVSTTYFNTDSSSHIILHTI
jgi:hypothetical protein